MHLVAIASGEKPPARDYTKRRTWRETDALKLARLAESIAARNFDAEGKRRFDAEGKIKPTEDEMRQLRNLMHSVVSDAVWAEDLWPWRVREVAPSNPPRNSSDLE